MRLLTVEDARARMLAAVGHLDAEDVRLLEKSGGASGDWRAA